MNARRCIRLFVLAVIAAGFSACHFHGGGWGHHHHGHHHGHHHHHHGHCR